MNYTRCKSCKKQHDEKLNYQKFLVKHYADEAYFYSRLSTVLFFVALILVAIIINIQK